MFPRSLGYVRRLKTEGVPLKRWCREALQERAALDAPGDAQTPDGAPPVGDA